MVAGRARNGLDFKDLEKLQPSCVGVEQRSWHPDAGSRELVSQMLAWRPHDRPTALDILQSDWIESGSRACKAARAATAPAYFGLWIPGQPGFEKHLRARTKRSLAYRLLLA